MPTMSKPQIALCDPEALSGLVQVGMSIGKECLDIEKATSLVQYATHQPTLPIFDMFCLR